jgi:hypothetical protein
MERTLTEPTLQAELERLLAEPARELPATPFPAAGEAVPAGAEDAFDAQILAGLVSP